MDKRRKHFKRVPPRVYTFSYYQKDASIFHPILERGQAASPYLNTGLGWGLINTVIWTRPRLSIIKIKIGEVTYTFNIKRGLL